MNFVDLQSTVCNAVKAAIGGTPPVYEDIGNVKSQKEAALDLQATAPGPGWYVAVWPPVSAEGSQESAGVDGGNVRIVCRFAVNPVFLIGNHAIPDASAWLNGQIQTIVSAVLTAVPEEGSARFSLASEWLELTDFDEGLIAYHIRFLKFAVL